MLNSHTNDPISIMPTQEIMRFSGHCQWSIEYYRSEFDSVEIPIEIYFSYTNYCSELTIKEVNYDCAFEVSESVLKEAINNELGQIVWDDVDIAKK